MSVDQVGLWSTHHPLACLGDPISVPTIESHSKEKTLDVRKNRASHGFRKQCSNARCEAVYLLALSNKVWFSDGFPFDSFSIHDAPVISKELLPAWGVYLEGVWKHVHCGAVLFNKNFILKRFAVGLFWKNNQFLNFSISSWILPTKHVPHKVTYQTFNLSANSLWQRRLSSTRQCEQKIANPLGPKSDRGKQAHMLNPFLPCNMGYISHSSRRLMF